MARLSNRATRSTARAQVKTSKQSAGSEPSAAAEPKATPSGTRASLRRRPTDRSEVKMAGITKAATKKSTIKKPAIKKTAIKKTTSIRKTASIPTSIMKTAAAKKAASIKKSAIKKTSSLAAFRKKRVSFHKAYQVYQESEEQREEAAAAAKAKQSSVARKPENSSYQLRGRFRNLRNANGKQLFRQNQTTKSADNKSSAAPQPASKGTRSASSVQSSTRASNGPSAESDARRHDAKSITVKLVRLLNCPICGGALDTAKHTCGR